MPAHRLALLASLLVAVAALTASPAPAVTCALDRVPGATLLLPYFEVDTANSNGVTTLFSINNSDQAGTLAQVTLWSDLAVPVVTFTVYLSGYDVVTANLRDIIVNGFVPTTSPPASYLGCPSTLPVFGPNYPSLVPYLQDALTGQSVVFPGAGNPVQLGVEHGDQVARGFLTVDAVNVCGAAIASETGYWNSGGTGIGNNRNILWGDYFYVDPGNDFAQGFNLVQLEADDALGAGDYTFYRRFSGGSDQREPLASRHNVRFIDTGFFVGETTIYYWRDPKRTILPFTPGTLPGPYPLGLTEIVVFDEAENFDIPVSNPFPYAAGKVVVGGPALPVVFNFGWIHVNLNTNVPGSLVPFDPVAQSTLAYTIHAGRMSIGVDATVLESACDLSPAALLLLPLPPLP